MQLSVFAGEGWPNPALIESAPTAATAPVRRCAASAPSRPRAAPIDISEVADRLISLAEAGPQGRTDDIGGPEVRTATGLARAWAKAHGRRRPVLAVPAPGAAFRAYREGAHLAPEHAVGRITFKEYLTATRPVPGRHG